MIDYVKLILKDFVKFVIALISTILFGLVISASIGLFGQEIEEITSVILASLFCFIFATLGASLYVESLKERIKELRKSRINN